MAEEPDSARMPEEPSEPRGTKMERWSERAVLVGVPAAVLVVGLAMVLEDCASAVSHDLQLFAPAEAIPGSSIGVRAYLFERGHDAATDATVALQLRDDQDRMVSDVELMRSRRAGFEGTIEVPTLEGRYQVRATIRPTSKREVTVAAPLHIHDRASTVATEPRAESALQVATLGPIESSSGRIDVLEPRVVGGACVPDESCELLTWVRAPSTEELRLAIESDTIDPIAESARFQGESLVPVSIIVRGPDALVRLVVTDAGGVTLATRSFQVPVVLGGISVEWLSERLPSVGAPPRFRVRGGSDAVLVDLFHNGYWAHATSVALDDEGIATLPAVIDEPGRWEVQVRPSLWTVEGGASVVIEAGTSWDGFLLARQAESPSDSFLATAAMPAADIDRYVAFASAPLEAEARTLAPRTRGRALEEAHVQAHRQLRITLTAIAFGLAGLLVGSWVFRRAMRASREADRVMSGTDSTFRQTFVDRLIIILACATIALLFVTVGLLFYVRGFM